MVLLRNITGIAKDNKLLKLSKIKENVMLNVIFELTVYEISLHTNIMNAKVTLSVRLSVCLLGFHG